jgi:hypothetical protein
MNACFKMSRTCVFLAIALCIARPSSGQTWKPPVAQKTLSNGLKVVVSEVIPRPLSGSASAGPEPIPSGPVRSGT